MNHLIKSRSYTVTVDGKDYGIKPEMIEVKRYVKKVHGKHFFDDYAQNVQST